MVEYLTAIERRFGKGGCVPWIRTYDRGFQDRPLKPLGHPFRSAERALVPGIKAE